LTGTNTDAVVIDTTKCDDKDSRGVISSFKHATTTDITTGIEFAVNKVLEQAQIDPGHKAILSLTIGTTVCAIYPFNFLHCIF